MLDKYVVVMYYHLINNKPSNKNHPGEPGRRCLGFRYVPGFYHGHCAGDASNRGHKHLHRIKVVAQRKAADGEQCAYTCSNDTICENAHRVFVLTDCASSGESQPTGDGLREELQDLVHEASGAVSSTGKIVSDVIEEHYECRAEKDQCPECKGSAKTIEELFHN